MKFNALIFALVATLATTVAAAPVADPVAVPSIEAVEKRNELSGA